MAGEVEFGCRLHNTRLMAWHESQVVHLLVGITPRPVLRGVRMPLNLCFVLDRSDSMKEEDKIETVKEAVRLALRQMQMGDAVSIVTFNNTATVDVESSPLSDLSGLERKIDRIQASDGTRISTGLQKGIAEVRKGHAGGHRSPNQVSRILLLTDGETMKDEDRCLELASECRQMGVPITALGLGSEWNEDLLYGIAERSGGIAEWLQSPDSIVDCFQNTIQQMQAASVVDVRLRLHMSRGVSAQNAYRVTPVLAALPDTLSGSSVELLLGNAEPEQLLSVYLRLRLEPRPQPGMMRLARAELVYSVPTMNLYETREMQDIAVELCGDPSVADPAHWHPEVRAAYEAVTTFEMTKRGQLALRHGDLDKATQLLGSATTRLQALGDAEGALATARLLETATKLLQAKPEDAQQAAQKLDFKDVMEHTKRLGETVRLNQTQ